MLKFNDGLLYTCYSRSNMVQAHVTVDLIRADAFVLISSKRRDKFNRSLKFDYFVINSDDFNGLISTDEKRHFLFRYLCNYSINSDYICAESVDYPNIKILVHRGSILLPCKLCCKLCNKRDIEPCNNFIMK